MMMGYIPSRQSLVRRVMGWGDPGVHAESRKGNRAQMPIIQFDGCYSRYFLTYAALVAMLRNGLTAKLSPCST